MRQREGNPFHTENPAVHGRVVEWIAPADVDPIALVKALTAIRPGLILEGPNANGVVQTSMDPEHGCYVAVTLGPEAPDLTQGMLDSFGEITRGEATGHPLTGGPGDTRVLIGLGFGNGGGGQHMIEAVSEETGLIIRFACPGCSLCLDPVFRTGNPATALQAVHAARTATKAVD